MTIAATPTATLNTFDNFPAEKDGLTVQPPIEEFARIGRKAMDKNVRSIGVYSVAGIDKLRALPAKVSVSKTVRINWTGCPDFCGQVQGANDISLMASKGRKDRKIVDAVDIFMGGTVGKDEKLGKKMMKGVALEDLETVYIYNFSRKIRC